ncbi:phosphoribosylpyrophosphate synthetase [Neolewinella lacunae]|uniref:Phosphoribosylpyrophosphate synthetase n=1 Tax=Neolewinella lacunae TaxID=1517758 RepID=A0A923PR82_9BACT|nr:phosphoribosylpyrophosphate synthetase [Neolewinella lacunae]MBC6995988.1 phosphoribosylpyrophosphate synthetase [Neolewinella lacunae]MDN3633162.1 phosphoribosylpyrophosphate synthetase [Neolewinella lacunae]
MSKPSVDAPNTLSAAIELLRNEGYTYDFEQQSDCLRCEALDRNFPPEAFTIRRTFRFEGMSNPDDNSVLYAIEGNDGTRGMLVDAYGVYADSLTPEMIEKFRVDYSRPDGV